MLLSKTTQVKRLEVKLAGKLFFMDIYVLILLHIFFPEYHQSLKERTKECEKLSSALEKQQDNALRKINQLNETYDQSKKSSDAIILRLEESESKLTIAFDKLKEVCCTCYKGIYRKIVQLIQITNHVNVFIKCCLSQSIYYSCYYIIECERVFSSGIS